MTVPKHKIVNFGMGDTVFTGKLYKRLGVGIADYRNLIGKVAAGALSYTHLTLPTKLEV